MPEQTAEEIARGLLNAERTVILQHNPYRGTRDRGWPEPTRQPNSFQQAGRPLMEMGIVKFLPDWRDSRTRLTPLGIEVRAILAGEGKTPHARSGE